MKRLFLPLALIAALAFPAHAAERKPLVIGATGQQQQILATDTLKVSAATTANASINIPPGVAPTSPNNGDCWTTSSGLYCQIAGVTVGPMGSGGGSPGGSSGQIQYNNSGAFGGFTASGDATVNTSTGVVTVAQAAKWTTARTLAITGDLAYTSPSLDGSGNVTAAGTLATVNSNVGAFTNANITVNAKGLITAAANGSAGSSITAKDDGSTLTTAVTSLDFTGTGVTATNVGGAVTVNVPLASSGSVVASAGLVAPQGRLTLVTGVPVMVSDQTAKTHVYYTSYIGASVPVFDGTNWTQWVLGSDLDMALDTSNQLAENVYDLFVWNNSGVLSIGAGPAWSNAATVTVTIATPAVVTWTAHGLAEGAPVIFTNAGGALPTGITAGTTYYVGRSPLTNSFNISTSVANAAAGTFVATSGSQSGTHTGTNHTTLPSNARFSATAATAQLQYLNGILTNAATLTLTNGAGAGTSAAANRATYVGSAYMTANGQTGMAFIPAAASGGAHALLGLFNAYNRVLVSGVSRNNKASWTTASTSWQAADGSSTFRVTWVDGLQVSRVQADHGAIAQSSGTGAIIGVTLDSTTADPLSAGMTAYSTTFMSFSTPPASVAPQLGLHYLQAMQAAGSATTQTFLGSGTSPTRQFANLRAMLEM